MSDLDIQRDNRFLRRSPSHLPCKDRYRTIHQLGHCWQKRHRNIHRSIRDLHTDSRYLRDVCDWITGVGSQGLGIHFTFAVSSANLHSHILRIEIGVPDQRSRRRALVSKESGILVGSIVGAWRQDRRTVPLYEIVGIDNSCRSTRKECDDRWSNNERLEAQHRVREHFSDSEYWYKTTVLPEHTVAKGELLPKNLLRDANKGIGCIYR